MPPERSARIKEILGAALERPDGERAEYLDCACRGDAELRGEAERQLAETVELSPGSPFAAPLASNLPQPAPPGQIINAYRVLGRLGAGGFGVVYKAVDSKLGRHVALKFLPPMLDLDEDARTALVNEARAASALDHPNIGTIYGIEDTSDGHRFIVMACYEGQTLAQRLRQGPLPAEEAAAVALQIASGLAEAHAHNIVHRDVKPSNVFLTRQGRVKILDFGLARVIRSTTATLSANISGTAAYMSPEQAQGRFLDARTDLWSLGVVLYEMITGHRAFSAGDLPATLFAIVNAPPPDLGANIPGALQKITYRSLAKQPEDRYQSAAEMMVDLRRLSGPEGPADTPEEIRGYRQLAAGLTRAKNRRRYLRWQFALPALLVAVAALLSTWRPGATQPAASDAYLKAIHYIQRYEKPENLDQAVSLLKGVVKADSNSALAFAALGEAYWQKYRVTGDSSLLVEAESNARRALQLSSRSARVHIVMGQVQSALGNRDLAQEHYQRAQQFDPYSPDALIGLAREEAARQRLTEAEGLYRKAVALQPDYAEGYNNLGIFLKGRQRPDEAAQQFREMIRLTPDSIKGYVNLAAALIDGGHLDEAEATLQKASQIDPSSYTAHLNLGMLYLRRRLFPQAEKELRQAVALNDKDWLGWVDLAVAHRWLNHDGQALAAYKRSLPLLEEAVRVQPKQATLRATLAEIYAYTGDSDKAVSSANAALAHDPQSPTVLLSCADVYAVLGNRSLAAATANKAVANGLTLDSLDADPEARRFRTDPNFKPPTA